MKFNFLALITICAFSSSVFAHDDLDSAQRPLWELGLGGGGTYTPDYPSSDQNHLWAIPFPYAVYRGEFLHSDRRGGTRARFVKSASYEVNVSGTGGLPSSSAQNHAREDMPNLEWIGEFGPRLMFDLVTPNQGQNLFRLGLPVRAAFSSNFEHLRDQGFTFAPELLYDIPHVFGSPYDAFALLTTNFTDRRFAGYFYGVKPDNAKPDRPAYTAKAGYLLTDLSMGLWLPIPSYDLKIAAFGSIKSLHGSANEKSPLYRQQFNASIGLVVIWVFAQSERTVVPED